MSGRENGRQRLALYARQNGHCHWCGAEMLFDTPGRWGTAHPRTCTLDHIDDRLSPERGKHGGEIRRVAACQECNNERSNARAKALSIEEQHLRSQGHRRPKGMPRREWLEWMRSRPART